MNTKLTFYCSHIQYGNFEKIIFETIVPDTIDNIDDAKEWLDDSKINEIYHNFALDLVLDWVIINQQKTSEKLSDVDIIKTVSGSLVFEDETNKYEVKDELDELKKDIDKLVEKANSLTKENKQLVEINGILNNIIDLKNKNKKLVDDLNKQKEKNKEEDKDYQSAWIDPSGKKYNVAFAEHNNFAAHWLKKNYPEEYKYSSKYDYEVLQDKGWIRILGWSTPPQFVIQNVTPKQKEALKNYCISEKIPYEFWPEILKS